MSSSSTSTSANKPSTSTDPSSPANNPGQLSPLPPLTRHITTHSPSSGLATIHSSTPLTWSPYDSGSLAFAVPYTTSLFPPLLSSPTNPDITTHESLVGASGNLGLVNPGGTVLRVVDFAPGYSCAMHRTVSLDYGIVLEGEVDMVLDGGETVRMRRGDVAVQRGTMHQWVNRSGEGGEWARMVFVLQDCGRVEVGGRKVGEDLGDTGGLPPSGN